MSVLSLSSRDQAERLEEIGIAMLINDDIDFATINRI